MLSGVFLRSSIPQTTVEAISQGPAVGPFEAPDAS